MNNYCIKINLKYDTEANKIKMDYNCSPVSFLDIIENEYFFKSKVSNSVFSGKEKRIGYITFKKSKNSVYFEGIFSSDKEQEEFEKKYIHIVEKYIKSRIPFRFKYKAFLRKRILRMFS